MYSETYFDVQKKRLSADINGSFDPVLSEIDLGNVDAWKM